METDILRRISEESQYYSKRQKAIAKYIMENSEIAPFMTAQMLAEAAGVSESSVVRFARQLGCGGYSELRRAMQQLIRDRLANAEEEAAEGEGQALGRTVAAARLSLQAVLTVQNQRALEQAAGLLGAAEEIVVQAGLGMAGLELYFASALHALGYRACAAPAGLSREIFDLKENTVLVIIGGSYFSGLVGPARYAKAQGAGVLLLADDGAVPMRKYADVLLQGKGIVAASALIEGLLSALEISSGANLGRNLAALDALHREYNTYELTEN